MGKKLHTVITTNGQIDAAIARAKEFASRDLRVTEARYDGENDRVCLRLADGVEVAVPRTHLQGLEGASPAELSAIEILGSGTGIRWTQLDVDHYVSGVLNHVFGTRQWMAHLGRLGGTSKSRAKATAARVNGRKGGRPRKNRSRVRSVAPDQLTVKNRDLHPPHHRRHP